MRIGAFKLERHFGVRFERRLQAGMGIIVTVTVLLLVLFPVYWLVLNSVRPLAEMFVRIPQFWTSNLSLESYAKLFTPSALIDFPKSTLNTVIAAGGSTILSLVTGVMAALALSRLRFRGRQLTGMLVFFAYLLPPTMLFIPLYVMLASLHLNDTLLGLILAYSSFSVPFTTWMMRGYFQSIPRELEEAAIVDGCSTIGAWFRVVLPLASPGIAASGIFAFTYGWNEYLYAYVLTETYASRTMAINLTYFITHDVTQWDKLAAGAVVSAILPVVLYFIGQRFIVAGLTAGAVKG